MDMQALLIANKETVRRKTRTLYPRIPADRLGWAPAPRALTLGQLLRHVHQAETGLVDVGARSG